MVCTVQCFLHRNVSLFVEENWEPKKMLLPCPVPMYTPTPVAMYSTPAPYPILVPVPIPVPCFIPTSRKTSKSIYKKIKVSVILIGNVFLNRSKYQDIKGAIASEQYSAKIAIIVVVVVGKICHAC